MLHLIEPAQQGPICTQSELLDQRIGSDQAAAIRRLFTRLQPNFDREVVHQAADTVSGTLRAVEGAKQDLQELEVLVENYEKSLSR